MSVFDNFKFKCRNCFQLFDIDQKCFSFSLKHRELIEDISGLKVPFIVGDDESAKICELCNKYLVNYSEIKTNMIELQNGFIQHFWQARANCFEPADIPEAGSTVEAPEAATKEAVVAKKPKLHIISTEKPCNYCGVFVSKEQSWAHLTKFHPEKIITDFHRNFRCCAIVFPTELAAKMHCNSVHGGERKYKWFPVPN